MQQALAVAIDAAHAAGRAIRDLYGRDISITQKGASGPVSEADLGLNGVPMAVSPTADLAVSTFCVSRTESGKGLLKGLEGRLNLEPRGSIAYKCGLVAGGRYSGVFTCNPRNEWDICAGVALIEAAGGHVTDRQGEPYRFNQADSLKKPLVAKNTHVHAALLAVLNESGVYPRSLPRFHI